MHARLDIENAGYTVCACHCFIQGNDKGSQLDQFYDHLRHIVVKSHNLSLLHGSEIYLYACLGDEDHGCNIDEHIDKWI